MRKFRSFNVLRKEVNDGISSPTMQSVAKKQTWKYFFVASLYFYGEQSIYSPGL